MNTSIKLFNIIKQFWKRFTTIITPNGFSVSKLSTSLIIILFAILFFRLFSTFKFENFYVNLLFLIIVLAFLAIFMFIFYKKKNKYNLINILIVIIASLLGGINGGIFGSSASVILWPIIIAYFFRLPIVLSVVSFILTFVSIGILHYIIPEKLPLNLDVYFNVLSNGISIFLISIVLNLGSNANPKFNEEIIVAKKEIEEVKAKSQDRTRYIAELSHEIRTPLNAILGFTDTMREELFGKLQPQYREYAELIHSSGTHLLDLVGDILDLSKIESGKYNLNLTKIDLVNTIKSSLKMMEANARKAGVNLYIYGVSPVYCFADEKSIRQIILNLISNSIKFTDAGGKIEVHVYEDIENAWIDVNDTGRGLTPDELLLIQEPYNSTDVTEKGIRSTGLGLAVVRRLIEMHGGVFTINSQKNIGTYISIELKKNKTL